MLIVPQRDDLLCTRLFDWSLLCLLFSFSMWNYVGSKWGRGWSWRHGSWLKGLVHREKRLEQEFMETKTNLGIVGSPILHLLKGSEDEKVVFQYDFYICVQSRKPSKSHSIPLERIVWKPFINKFEFATMKERRTLSLLASLQQAVFCAASQTARISNVFKIFCNRAVISRKNGEGHILWVSPAQVFSQILFQVLTCRFCRFDECLKTEIVHVYANLYKSQVGCERDATVWQKSLYKHICAPGFVPLGDEDLHIVDLLLYREHTCRACKLFTKIPNPHVGETSCMKLIWLDAVMISIVDWYNSIKQIDARHKASETSVIVYDNEPGRIRE